MKNIIISFILFIVMLSFMLLSINYLDTVCISLGELNNNLEEYVISDSWDLAKDCSTLYLEDWKSYSKKISIFVNHQEIDNIDNELWKLTQYIKCKNKDESLASIHVLKFYLGHIINLERISIRNLF